MPLGSVRLTERFIHHDPPAADESRRHHRAPSTRHSPQSPSRRRPATLVGVAGTVTSLAAMAEALVTYDPARVHGYRLSQRRLAEQIARLRVGTQAARERIIGLDPRRADVILAGALILRANSRGRPVPPRSWSATADPLGPHVRAGRKFAGRGPRLIRPGSDGIFWPCAAPGSHGSRRWRHDRCRVPRRSPLIEPRSPTTSNAPELGSAWNATSTAYRIEGGKLEVSNAYNHPAWLRRRLPPNAVIDFDVVPKSPAGDIKVEMYGDGESFDPDKGSYASTGYVLIFGGWHNTLSVICRMEEHGAGRKAERNDVKVSPASAITSRSPERTGPRLGHRRPPFSGLDRSRAPGRPRSRILRRQRLGGRRHFDNLRIRPAP